MRFFEIPNSRGGTLFPPSIVQRWRCTGTCDSTLVRGLAASATSDTVIVDEGILYRQTPKVEPDGHANWIIEVPYGPKNVSLASARITFDTTGGTIHITAAKESIARFPSDAPDHKGLIGVKDAKTVEGADIVIPASKRTVTFRHPIGQMSLSQIDYLEEITGMVNSTPFMGRAPGEVLFLGAKGSEGTDVETECAYDFAFSKNLTSATIAGITGVNKKGWHLYWVSDTPAVDGGKPCRNPKAIYVERVYDEIDLAGALGFGA